MNGFLQFNGSKIKIGCRANPETFIQKILMICPKYDFQNNIFHSLKGCNFFF